MKNNTLAMLATISLVLGLASLIGYIDPAVCEGRQSGTFITCEQAAAQHVAGFWGFTAFGVVVLAVGTIRAAFKRRAAKTANRERA
ncbi:MAG: hypothetical protein RL645_709 [Actinomycetota bacterium]|jgi:hypothetical protein